MAQLLVPSTFQVAIEAEAAGQQIINVIGIRSDDVTKTANGVGFAVKAAWESATGPLKLLSTSVLMKGYRTTDLRSLDGDIDFQPSSTTGGVSSAPFSTLAVAALVQYGQGTRNRSSRGRLYFGPLSEQMINSDGRTLSSGTVNTVTAAMESFRAQLAASEMFWAVISRVQSKAYTINSIGVANVVATQRRRLR